MADWVGAMKKSYLISLFQVCSALTRESSIESRAQLHNRRWERNPSIPRRAGIGLAITSDVEADFSSSISRPKFQWGE